MARIPLTIGLIVLHLVTIVHVSNLYAQEQWQIQHQPVISAQPDQPVGIEAQLEGRTTGVLMYIMARKAGQKDFRSFSMSAAGGTLFEGQIPAKWVTTEGLEYYLRCQDTIGRMLARYPEDETFIGVVVSTAEPGGMETPAEEPEAEPETAPQEEETGSEATPPPGFPPVTPQQETGEIETPPEEEDESEAIPPPGFPPVTPQQETGVIETPPPGEEEIAEPPEPEAVSEETGQSEALTGEPEVAETPPRKPVVQEEEQAVPPEKPEIVMEEKKGGLQTWHWLGLGALAVVGIAAVAMSGGDDGGGNGRTPSSKLPDPPDHP